MMSKGEDSHFKFKEKEKTSKDRTAEKSLSHCFSKTRTKTGCFTCRKRKKKCDEHYPVCSGCARNFLNCVWPEHKCDTLPKHFKITSGTAAHLRVKKYSTTRKSNEHGTAETSFFAGKHLSSILDRHPSYNDLDVPNSMCSVIPLELYKHELSPSHMEKCTKSGKIPGVMSFKIRLNNVDHKRSMKPVQLLPRSMLFINASDSQSAYSHEDIINDANLTNVDSHKPVDQRSVDQMFTSLYDTLQTKKLPWDFLEYSDPETEDTSVYHNFIESLIPKVLSKSYATANSLKVSCLRELFYAYGSLCLIKMFVPSSVDGVKDYFAIADRHYEKAIQLITNYCEQIGIGHKLSFQNREFDLECEWMLPCICIIRENTRNLDLMSKETLDNIMNTMSSNDPITIEEIERTLLVNFLFNYTIGLYFLPNKDLKVMPAPFDIFDKYRVHFSTVLFGKENREKSSTRWLLNVIQGSIFNCYENLCKLIWVLRHFEELSPQKKTAYLGNIKHDMTLIWTTLQTSDIQLDTSSDKKTSTLLVFAKYLHQSLEILHMKLTDPKLGPANPVIGFYVGQFLHIYKSLENDTDVPQCLKLAPLFICGCSSKSLDDRVFLTKELYFLARDLNLPSISTITAKLEDRWRIEETGGPSSLTSLITRCGFDICK
mgnify:FL=1